MRALAFHFTSPLTIEEMKPRLERAVDWTWYARDNDRWGDYYSAAPLPDLQIKLLYDPDGGYGLDINYKAATPDPRFEAILDTVQTSILPAIEAGGIEQVDSYE